MLLNEGFIKFKYQTFFITLFLEFNAKIKKSMQVRLLKNIIFTFGLMFISMIAFSQQNQTDDQGRKQGEWVKYKDGVKFYDGQFVDDYPVGEFLRYYKSGRLLSKSQYSEKGNKCMVEFFYDERKPKTKAKGLYINKEKDSLWLLYNDLGVLIAEESYDRGVAQGIWKLYTYTGAIVSETSYDQGKIHGAKKEFFEDGQVKRVMTFEHDDLQGDFEVYYPNRVIRTKGQFEMGLQVGDWLYYESDSTLWFKEVYEEGLLIERVDDKGQYFELAQEQDSVKIDLDPEKIMELE